MPQWQGHLCPTSSLGQNPLQASSLFLCAHKGTQGPPDKTWRAVCMVYDLWYGTRRSALEVWFSSTGVHLKLGVSNLGGSWGRRFSSAHTHVEYSQVVLLSVRFWENMGNWQQVDNTVLQMTFLSMFYACVILDLKHWVYSFGGQHLILRCWRILNADIVQREPSKGLK